MRIALIDPSLFTWPYDAALALALQSAGHQVVIFGKPLSDLGAGPAHGLLRAHFYRELDSDPANRLPRRAFLARKGLCHVRDMRRLLRELRSWKPDVIHIQWSPLPIVDRWFVPALRRIAPIVMTVHDAVPYNGSPRSRLQRMSAISIMRRFDRLIVHTKATAQRLKSYDLSEDRIRCIPHGPLGVALPIASAATRQRGAEDPVSILLFGQMKPYKGADVLLRALAAMRPEIRARCRVRIVGKPMMNLSPLLQFVREASLGDYVQFEPRFVPATEVSTLLTSADIIAMPYRQIDASGVLMMALGVGVPIVATRVGVFAEILEDGKHGRVVEVDDHLALAGALEELVTDPVLRARMGAAARRLRDEIPGWDAIAGLTLQVYRELLPAVWSKQSGYRSRAGDGREVGQAHPSGPPNIC
jgi:glycosyltransferase involved in cell wall biosynthesis